MVTVLLALACLGYFAAAVGFQYNLFHRQKRTWGRWLQLVLASNALHTLALGWLTVQVGHLPLSSMYEVITSLAWMLTVFYVILGHHWKIDALGTVAAPAAAVLTGFSAIALSHDSAGPAQGPWFFVHVASLVASYAAFFLAAFCAILYFVQSRRLKKKQLRSALMLPSLDTLDRVAFRFILVGFPLMVLGVVSGTLISGWRWTWDSKETLVGATCVVYLVYLHARMIAGWQGRRVNMILLVAFFGVLVSLLAPANFTTFEESMSKLLRLGTRSSALARTQSQWVADQLEGAWPGLRVELVFIKTSGDMNRVDPLASLGGKGVFTREIEVALLENSIDLAVHSLKDLPTDLPAGLRLGATPKRADARDALVGPAAFHELPAGAVVGTGSLRRQAQLKALRPDLQFRDIRGNVPTRIEKWRSGDYTGGVVLAMAGLERLRLLGPDVYPLEQNVCLSAPCQGILGLECRDQDESTLHILAAMEDPDAALEAEVERAYLRELVGGCNLPAGARAWAGPRLTVQAVLEDANGRLRRLELHGDRSEAAELGRQAAQQLRR